MQTSGSINVLYGMMASWPLQGHLCSNHRWRFIHATLDAQAYTFENLFRRDWKIETYLFKKSTPLLLTTFYRLDLFLIKTIPRESYCKQSKREEHIIIEKFSVWRHLAISEKAHMKILQKLAKGTRIVIGDLT